MRNAEITIEAHLKEIRTRLDEAASHRQKRRHLCCSRHFPKVIEIALDREQIFHELNTFLNAANMMPRLWKT
jgi:hypothetical protein